MRNSSVPKRARRPAGRPQSPRVREAVLGASLAVIAERGVAGATVDLIAARAGVGKHSIYRRWRSKQDLLVDALAEAVAMPLPDEVPADATMLIREIASVWVTLAEDPVLRAFAAQVFAEAARDPQLLEVYEERVAQPRRARVLALLEVARERGQLRPDTDLDVAADLLIGPAFYRMMSAGPRPPFRDGYLDALVNALCTGIVKEAEIS